MLFRSAPAPEDGVPRAMFGVNLLTPNQGEAKQLLGVSCSGVQRQGLILIQLGSNGGEHAAPEWLLHQLLSNGIQFLALASWLEMTDRL